MNELTLGIERMGRLGDVDTVNVLRRKLAGVLGVPYDGDVTAATLAGPASTLSEATKAGDNGGG